MRVEAGICGELLDDGGENGESLLRLPHRDCTYLLGHQARPKRRIASVSGAGLDVDVDRRILTLKGT